MKRRTGYLKKTAVVTMAALMAASAALTGVCAAEAQEF